MFFAYFDESGDDGFPKYSSPLFSLSAIYFHNTKWRNNFDKLQSFRKSVRDDYGLLLKEEIHTKDFLLNKNPYRKLGISDADRVAIIGRFLQTISHLDARSTKVVINKSKITYGTYNVLDTAFTYTIQRICNYLDSKLNPTPDKNFIIITDYGRVGKMRHTARRIQKTNPVPSRSVPGVTTNHPINSLLGDPLPQDSKNSYFIQASDCVAYIVYLHLLWRVTKSSPTSRLPAEVNQAKVSEWLEVLNPIHSVYDSKSNEHGYGIVCYPK